MELYVLNPKNYRGYVLTTMQSDELICRYSRMTFAQMNEENNGDLVLVTKDENYEKYYKPYIESLQKPFEEISEIDYYEALNCLPPVKWHDIETGINVFFSNEAYTGTLHYCYMRDKVNNKFYSALRCRYAIDIELLTQLKKIL